MTIQLPGPLIAAELAGAEASAAQKQADIAAAQSEQLARQIAMLEQETAEMQNARAALENALLELAQLQQKVLQDAEHELVDLAVGIANKVLMQEIQADKYEIEPIVKEALLHVPSRKEVVVHLNPEDWARCEMGRSPQSEAAGMKFIADPCVNKAECLLETAEGCVESSIGAGLRNIADALKGS